MSEAPLYGAPSAGSLQGELAARHGASAVEHRYYGGRAARPGQPGVPEHGQALLDLAACTPSSPPRCASYGATAGRLGRSR